MLSDDGLDEFDGIFPEVAKRTFSTSGQPLQSINRVIKLVFANLSCRLQGLAEIHNCGQRPKYARRPGTRLSRIPHVILTLHMH
jgi:hypothetical protein